MVGVGGLGLEDNRICFFFEDGIKVGNFVVFGVNKGVLWFICDDISGLFG